MYLWSTWVAALLVVSKCTIRLGPCNSLGKAASGDKYCLSGNHIHIVMSMHLHSV